MTYTLWLILAWYSPFHNGELLERDGRFQEAAVQFEAALKTAQSLQTPVTLNNLGVVYRALGRPHDAEVSYRRAISFYEGRPELATALATTLENLAALYLSQGQLSKAEPLYRRSYETRLHALPKDDRAIAESLQGLASLEQERGHRQAAERYYREALAIRESAPALHNLATLLAEGKHDAEARGLYERALALYRATPGHPGEAVVLRHLAELDARSGDIAQARAEFERALAICENSLPAGHPQTGIILQAYGKFLKSRAMIAKGDAIVAASAKSSGEIYTIEAASLRTSR
jgi:Tfp pilus assembly protein PilF